MEFLGGRVNRSHRIAPDTAPDGEGAFSNLQVTAISHEIAGTVEAALEERASEKEYADLEHLRKTCRFLVVNNTETEIVANDPAWQDVKSTVECILNRKKDSTTILITGETGAGKELVARLFQKCNPDKKDKPFISVNCSGIPSELLESELFGHQKGSYTGAHETTEGIFRAAGNGIVFLDEIGDMPLPMQAKLLRALEQRRIMPVGSTKEYPVEAQVICATNRNLEMLSREGKFRKDLFYRITGFPIPIPPLRERINDIVPLIGFFAEKYRNSGEPVYIERSAINIMRRYLWPGNVRELSNVIEGLMTLCEHESITVEDCHKCCKETFRDYSSYTGHKQFSDYHAAMRKARRNYFEELLRYTHGNVSRAAKIAGIADRNNFRKLIIECGINIGEFRNTESK